MGDFDQAARYAVKFDPAGFCSWLTAPFGSPVRFVRWLDTRTVPFPGHADRTGDTVAEVEWLGRLWALTLEFQTEPDAEMLDRLWEYLARLRRELPGPEGRSKYPVAAALVNLTGPPQPDELRLELGGPRGAVAHLRAVVKTMREESAAATLADILAGRTARCLLPWVPLMRGGDEAGMIAEWKRVADTDPAVRNRLIYGGLAIVFAELTKCRPAWRRALEGWNVQKSVTLEEWRTEGRTEQARSALLRALRLRFKAEPPAEIVQAVEECLELGRLNDWLDAAIVTPSLDEFRKSMNS
jgi:hypothetical protein